MERGVIAMRQGPSRIVGIVKTYAHGSNPNVTVRVIPIPSVAHSSYWRQSLYGAHDASDYVLLEDGVRPLVSGTGAARRALLFEKVFQVFPHAPVADADVIGKKFVTAPPPPSALGSGVPRDPLESRMAFQSVTQNLSPPVDPRARRGVEFLESLLAQSINIAGGPTNSSPPPPPPPAVPSASGGTVASGRDAAGGSTTVSMPNKSVRVAMPWNVYHVPYLQHRLVANGWKEVSVEEFTLMTQMQVAQFMATITFVVSMFVMLFLTTLKVVLFG